MNFSELKTEFFARGTDYLSEDAAGIARAERWLNQAYREILSYQAWPFLVSETRGSEGAGFVSIPDLRKVLSVTDESSGRMLQRISREDLDLEANAADVGSPEYYWINGATTVQAYKRGGNIMVRYVRRVDPLTGTDEPVFDEEYHDLIIDRAMIKAYKDSDNFEAAAALRQEYEAGVASMTEDYMLSSREVQFIKPTGLDV